MAVSQPPVQSAPDDRAHAPSPDRWERLAPLTGAAAFVFFLIGSIVLEGAESPGENEPAQAYFVYFDEESGAILTGGLLLILGSVLLLWFAGSLRTRLAAAEGGSHRLASLAFAGAVAMVTLMLGAVSMEMSGAVAIEEADVPLGPEAAQALVVAGDGLWFAAWYGGVVFLLATALAMLRHGVLPRWLAWVTVAMAVVLAVPWVGWAIFFFLLPLWILGVSILLWREGSRSPAGG